MDKIFEFIRSCKWVEDEDGIWDTECGERHLFETGTPKENMHRWCPYCGLKIVGTEHDGLPPGLKSEIDKYSNCSDATIQGLMKLIATYVIRERIIDPMFEEYQKDPEGFVAKAIKLDECGFCQTQSLP